MQLFTVVTRHNRSWILRLSFLLALVFLVCDRVSESDGQLLRSDLVSAPTCPVDQSVCLEANNCPPGCPNLAAQLVTWLASVNAKANGVKFSSLSFDGEDGGKWDTATKFGLP